MKRTFAPVLAAGILLAAKPACAHRIDEYLQATILSVEANRVEASMRLIPGILVAPSVIAGIDSNGDGAFSEIEMQTYARRVLGDLSITVDGKNARPALLSFSFPEPAQMREGLGEIHIEYAIRYAGVTTGQVNRRLIITNHHLNRASVYLMNVLVPRDPSIRIAGQKRNEQQSIYE